MRRLASGAAVLSLLLIGGCADPAAPPPDLVPRVDKPPISSTPTAAPTAVDIPAIGAASTLIPIGLNPDRTMAVPPVTEPRQAAWYSLGPRPGDAGPAVIVGHVDGVIDGRRGQPGVFYYLDELAPGDLIYVDRADGSRVTFVVYAVESHLKAEFPTTRIYGDTPGPEIRLITCSGSFDRATGHYVENTVILGRLL